MSLKEHYRRQHKIFLGKTKANSKGPSKPPCLLPRLNHKVSLLTRELETYQDLVKSECPDVIMMDPFVNVHNGDGTQRLSIPQPACSDGHGTTNILMVQQGETGAEDENRSIIRGFSLASTLATTITTTTTLTTTTPPTTGTAAAVGDGAAALSLHPQFSSIQQHNSSVVLTDSARPQLSGTVGPSSSSRKVCGSVEGVRVVDMETGRCISSSSNNNSSNGKVNGDISDGGDVVLVHSVDDGAENISLMHPAIIDNGAATRVMQSLQQEEEEEEEEEEEDNDNEEEEDDDDDEDEEEVVINMSKELINLSEHFNTATTSATAPPQHPPPQTLPPTPSLPSISLDTTATFSDPPSTADQHSSSNNEDDNEDDMDALHSVPLPGLGPSSAMHSESGSTACTTSRPDFTFFLVTSIVRGNSFTYGKQSFKCVHCPFRTHWKSSMINHMRDKHPEILSQAPSTSVSDLGAVPVGDNQRLMRMSDYNKLMVNRFKTRSSSTNKRVRSIEKQDLLGSYPCTKCTKVFNRLRYLRKHTQIHRTDAMFFCDACGKGFKTRTYLAAHERTHKKGAYRCRQCGFTSKINAAIHAHRQLHNEGSVICDICGFAYTDKSTLNKHKRVHDPIRPFACTFPGCTWRFKTDVMCQAHFRAHTTQGKFRCSVCGYLFRHKHHLQRHELKMHGVQQTKSRLPKPAAAAATTAAVMTEGSLVIAAAPVAAAKATTASATPAVAAATNTLSLIVDPDDVVVANGNHVQLEAALHNSQQHHLVITAECQGETIDYDMSDVTMMNVSYRSILPDAETTPTSAAAVGVSPSEPHPQTILIPQAHCGQVIFQTAGLESV
ncbi:zinc finger protein ZFAT-like [Octopus vulgaris]|nr:zinc finger protein ZFAT-like [Octopus vulgaris]